MSASPALVRELAEGVNLVDAAYVMPELVATYFVRGRDSVAIVETGHVHAVPRMLAALAASGLSPEDVSHVVVTHVHLDHAGGAGALMSALPRAALVVHPRGARHMIEPSKLWAGTEGVYGAELTRALYGEPIAVPASRVLEAHEGFTFDLGARPLVCLDAPGHARHHLVLFDQRTRGMFTGDSFGLSYRQTDSARGPFFYPTTTPVQFDPVALHQTYDRILAAGTERVYLTHYGMVEGELGLHAASLHRQLDTLVRCAQQAPRDGRHDALKQALADALWAELCAHETPLSRDAALAFFENDLELNARGLEVWLDRGA